MSDRFSIQTAQNVDLAMAPAGLGERILAWLADIVIVVGYVLLASWALGELGAQSEWLAILVVALPVLLYHLAFEVFFEGRTPGKMALRLRVARVDGAQPTLGQYLLRWLLRLVDVTFTSGTVAVVAIAVTQRSQRLGDIVAGTTVIKRRRRVRLDEVLYPDPAEGYEPTFTTADTLSDADVRTVRAVLVRLRLSKGDKRSSLLAGRAKEAVEAKLGLGPVQASPEAFLRTVVKDHTHLLDRYQ